MTLLHERTLKLQLQAAIMLLCLLALCITSYVWGSTNTKSIPSLGTIIDSHSATLLFKSSWESPVEFTSSQKIYFKGADQGFDWAELTSIGFASPGHMFHYVGGQLGVDVDSQLSTVRAHSGSRSLYQAKLTREGSWRSQLIIYTDDNVFGNKIFVRRWLYYPTDFDLPEKGWMAGVFSHRELTSDPQFTVGMGIWRNSKFSNDLFWAVEGLIYQTSGAPDHKAFFEVNTDVPIPKGRWFKLEEYIERHPTDGVVKVWVDGQLIFDLSGVMTKTPWGEPLVGNMVGKVMVGSEDYGYTYPYYHWIDDLEIWDGIPQ